MASGKKIFEISAHIIGHGSHVEFLISTKNSNFAKYKLMNIHAKFDSNGSCGFGEDRNVKSLQTMIDI